MSKKTVSELIINLTILISKMIIFNREKAKNNTIKFINYN